jgi:hypothetical protein
VHFLANPPLLARARVDQRATEGPAFSDIDGEHERGRDSREVDRSRPHFDVEQLAIPRAVVSLERLGGSGDRRGIRGALVDRLGQNARLSGWHEILDAPDRRLQIVTRPCSSVNPPNTPRPNRKLNAVVSEIPSTPQAVTTSPKRIAPTTISRFERTTIRGRAIAPGAQRIAPQHMAMPSNHNPARHPLSRNRVKLWR